MSLEAKNKQRAELGLPPIVESKDGDQGNGQPPAGPTGGAPSDPPAPPAPAAPVIPDDLDDATLLSILQKRKFNVKSLDDLRPTPSEAEIRAERDQREANKLSWGLQNKKVTKELYDGYVQDSNDIRTLVFNDFRDEALREDPNATMDEIEADFADRFGENEPSDSRKFKRGQKELGIIADKLLHGKYAQVYQLENEFSNHENSTRSQREAEQHLLDQAPKYKADVDEVIAGLKVQKDKVIDRGNVHETSFEVPEEVINEVLGILLHTDNVRTRISMGWTKDDIRKAADYLIYQRIRPTLLSSTAKSYAAAEFTKRYGDRKGVFPTEGQPAGSRPGQDLNDRQAAWRKELGMTNVDGTPTPTAS